MASKITINRGTTFKINVAYTKSGLPASLDGGTVFFTAKAVEYDSDALDTTAVISKTITSHVDGPGGLSLISILPADTASLLPTVAYYYDIKVKDLSGEIYKIDEGRLTINGSPTNRVA